MNINELLQELYALDPSLKEQESELTQVLTLMIKNKPDIKIDPVFVSSLKEKILLTKFNQKPMKENFFSKYSIAPWALAGVSLVIAVVVSVPTLKNTALRVVSPNSASYLVSDKGSNAFGSLAQLTGASEESAPLLGSPEAMSTSSVAPVEGMAYREVADSASNVTSSDTPTPSIATSMIARPQSGGGFAGVSNSEPAQMVPQPIDAKMAIWIPPVTYRYVYDKEIDLSNIPSAVYKRNKDTNVGGRLFSNISSTVLDMMDLSSIRNGKITNFQFNDGGNYSVSVDLNENMVSLYPDYSKRGWEYYSSNGNEFTLDNYPSDDAIINVASQFLGSYGISTEKYGAPLIDKSWRNYVILAQEKGEQYYIPQDASVRFPLQFEGKNTYEGWGGTYGINVSVNLNKMEVTGVYDVVGLNFDKSDYAMVTDAKSLTTFIENGGIDPIYYYRGAEETKVEDVQLGEPELVYNRYYQWNRTTNNELFIPALKFPVISKPGQYEYAQKESVIIPLAQEILDARSKENLNPPVPMPYESVTPMVK